MIHLRICLFLLAGLFGCDAGSSIPKVSIKEENQPKLTQAPDSLVIRKSERKMRAYKGGKEIKWYKICLGGNPLGHKQFEGDQRTPEGIYYINDKNPNSDYHKNLGISYPNEKDVAYARSQGKSAGGDIKIHGFPNGKEDQAELYMKNDWTWGCVAVTNDAIDELYEKVKVGTVIHIYP